MNETTAAIAGSEIGIQVMEEYYPELAGRLKVSLKASSPKGMPGGLTPASLPLDHPDPGDLPRPVFDFRAEMHETRVTADAMLVEGRVAEAEAYMKQRQQFFLHNGYLIRKLNQAYFAFHGAYADVPGGAAGEDPVGPAVRSLREQSPSLAAFINSISWMSSYEDLKQAINE
jgi:hypothetical protein